MANGGFKGPKSNTNKSSGAISGVWSLTEQQQNASTWAVLNALPVTSGITTSLDPFELPQSTPTSVTFGGINDAEDGTPAAVTWSVDVSNAPYISSATVTQGGSTPNVSGIIEFTTTSAGGQDRPDQDIEITVTDSDQGSSTVTVTAKVMDVVYTAATGGDEIIYLDSSNNVQSGSSGATYKVHVFNNDGDFVVNTAGDADVDWLIIAGGGGSKGTGSGAGGYRTSYGTGNVSGGLCATESAYTVSASTYTVEVGNGGTGSSGTPTKGGVSSVFGIESEGGGRGWYEWEDRDGGSGGGISGTNGTGGQPASSTCPKQGFAAGDSNNDYGSQGGGAGAQGQSNSWAGYGGAGLESFITGADGDVTKRGGGGGHSDSASGGYPYGGGKYNNVAGVANTGGGGGRRYGSGGKGVVIIRYPLVQL